MAARPGVWGRLLAVVLVIAASGALAAAGGLAFAVAPGVRRRFREGLFRATSRALLALLRVRVRVAGPAPRAPFLLVSNHLGYLDVLVLASVVPARFVAKSEVRRWPLLGAVCRRFGTVFIDRADRRDIPRVLVEIEAGLARGEGWILFPEGTSSSGETVLPFRSPLLALPARRALPVHAATLRYAPPSAGWWGEMALLPHLLALCRQRDVEASLTFAAEPVLEGDRKRLAERLRGVVAGQPAASWAKVSRSSRSALRAGHFS
jgi:1-acyl-sn-glycerol-3-phosphate acyltransferase